MSEQDLYTNHEYMTQQFVDFAESVGVELREQEHGGHEFDFPTDFGNRVLFVKYVGDGLYRTEVSVNGEVDARENAQFIRVMFLLTMAASRQVEKRHTVRAYAEGRAQARRSLR